MYGLNDITRLKTELLTLVTNGISDPVDIAAIMDVSIIQVDQLIKLLVDDGRLAIKKV